MKDTAPARQAWQLLKPHVRPRMGALALVVVLGLLASFAATSVVLLIEPLWSDVLFPAEQESRGPGLLGDLGIGTLVARWGGALGGIFGGSSEDPRLVVLWGLFLFGVLIGLVAAVSEYGFVCLSRWTSLRMVVDLRLRLARHLMGLSVRYHGERHFGDLLSRVSSDVTKTLDALTVALRDFIRYPADALCWLGVAFIAAPRLTLGVCLTLPIVLIPLSKLLKRVRRGSTASLTSLGVSVQALTQMFQGIRTVKAFRAEERELDRFAGLNEGYLGSSMRMVRYIALTRVTSVLMGVTGMAVLVVLVGYATIEWQLISDAPSFLIFFMAIAQVNSKLKTLARSSTQLSESVGASVRLQELMAEPVELVEAERPLLLDGLGSGVRFEGVSFSYPNAETPALAELDLVIAPGETVAVVGPSGAGKSTLIDLLCRFVDPSAGRITVDGMDLREISLDDWSRHYALVSQTPFLFHDTIEANVRYGRPDASQAEVEAAARAADIHDFILSLPRGYQTDVADAGAKLSGGQRQRITIARAILKGAPLLVLDEATSSLDSESEVSVQASLDRLIDGHTVLVVAHRLSTIRAADRIAVLDGGRLVELGSHDELITRGGVYARLAKLQGLTPGTKLPNQVR